MVFLYAQAWTIMHIDKQGRFDTQTHIHAYRLTGRQTCIQTCRQTHIDTHRHTYRQTDTHTDRTDTQ